MERGNIMIIKRQYATFGLLMKDEKSKQVILEAIKESSKQISEDEIEQILQASSDVIVYQADLGCGIPGDAYQQICRKFKTLDKTNPFDNGLDYRSVTKVVTFPSRKGNAMMQWLIRAQTSDLCAEIIQVIAFERDGSNIKPVEPWEPDSVIYF